MSIQKNSVVSFHYTVFEGGERLESSEGREPLTILYGAGNIIPGLEKALEGKAVGDRVEATVAPEEGYGARNENMVQRVPIKHFKGQKLEPGQTLMLRGQQGPIMATVKKVGMSVVDLDMNHPMAGKTLRFEVEITDVREASEEEIAHGHVHGPGGHEH
jgi:FKBP-type peptidyl-prolyl cis-trans isomerase SlyD